MQDNIVIKPWLEKSQQLIRKACTPWGIKASLGAKDNYNAIFTRDAVMAGIVGMMLEDEVIIRGFKDSLINLKKCQGKQGQIASNYKIEDDVVAHISYGTLSPKIDACTWYMIGVGLMIKTGDVNKDDFKESVSLTINLLDGLEYNGKHLMNIPRGGNWADEYIYDGYVLYDQVLRAWGLSILGHTYEVEEWSKKSEDILVTIQERYKGEGIDHYLASISPGFTFNKFDLGAHALLGIAANRDNSDINEAFDWINNQFINNGNLPPVFHPIISPTDPEWESLSNYYMFSFKNKPHHFHNGGIWWIWIGWYAVSLSVMGRQKELDQLLTIGFNFLEQQSIFDFNEYVSSDDMQLGGTKNLCYTATGIIFMSLAQESFDFSILRP